MTEINPVGTYDDPDNTSQTGSAYKNAIDNSMRSMKRIGNAFAPHSNDPADMTMLVDDGMLFSGVTLTEIGQQTSASFSAPTLLPRIDRIVGDQSSGVISIVAGTEAISPTAPAIPAGQFPIAQILLTVGMSTITDADIYEERALSSWDGGGGSSGVLESGNLLTGSATALILDLSPYAAYSRLVLQVDSLVFSAGGFLDFLFSTDGGSSYKSSHYNNTIAANQAQLRTQSTGGGSAGVFNLDCSMTGMNVAAPVPSIYGTTHLTAASGDSLAGTATFGGYNSASPTTNTLKLQLTGGNVTGGKYRLLGYT